MREKVGILVAACFYYSGLVKFARWLTQRSGPGLIILNYHRAAGGDLRRQLLYLRRHYRLLHLEEALEELYTPCREKREERDPRTPMVLTFDDGYRDSDTHAFRVAQELHVPITLFLIPGYIESGDYFWWLEGNRLVHRARASKVDIEGCTYHLGQTAERKLLVQKIDHRLRHAASVAEREVFLKAMRKALAVPVGVESEEEATLPLTWLEIHKMAESGWVSFGAHTMHHPILAYLSDPVELRREVKECREVLQEQLGHPIRTFAYPVGQPEHIGEEAQQAVREAGYDWAVTTSLGTNTFHIDPHQLRRVVVDVRWHWLVTAGKTSGVWHFFSPLWKWTHSVFTDEQR